MIKFIVKKITLILMKVIVDENRYTSTNAVMKED